MMREVRHGSSRSATRRLLPTARARRLSEEAVQHNVKRRQEVAMPAGATERAEGSGSAQDEVDNMARGGRHDSVIRLRIEADRALHAARREDGPSMHEA